MCIMIYAAELFYLQDQQDVPFQRAVLVTAKTVAQWCTHFQAKLLSHSKAYKGLTEKQGVLPAEPLEKQVFVTELIQWIFAYSEVQDLFFLLLDNEPMPRIGRVAKFDHHDDTCCWFLNLDLKEFTVLQEVWGRNNLPLNLFYPQEETICVPYPGNNLKSKVLRLLGVQRCYTPMQWQNLRNEKNCRKGNGGLTFLSTE